MCVGGTAQPRVQSFSDLDSSLEPSGGKQWAKPNTTQTEIENKPFLIFDLSGALTSKTLNKTRKLLLVLTDVGAGA